MKPKPLNPICPKCGYDQSGEVATWQSQCPMQGTCPECGLGFAWANVFDPGRVLLSWYIEHAASKREMCRRTPATLWMMLLPNRFWKRLAVHYPVNARRVWAFAFASVIVVCLLSIMMDVCVAALNTHKWNQLYTQLQAIDPTVAKQMGYIGVDMTEISYWKVSFGNAFQNTFNKFSGLSQSGFHIALMMLAMSLLWLTIMAAVPVTRRLAKLRIKHVTRAMALSCIGVLFAFLFALVSDSVLAAVSATSLTLNATQLSGSSGIVSYSYSRGRFFQIESIVNLIMTVGSVYAAIWVQWFWIAAIVRGWQIRSVMLPVLGLIASLLAGFAVFMYILVY